MMKDDALNVQTDVRDDRTAQLTVDIDPQRLEKAKKSAAKQIAKRVNIPGFRKGKAPYRILVQNGLEGQILMDAVEKLSQEVYRESLEQAELDPYGPGSFDDYEIDPPRFIYTVPLQPTVELNDYRLIRLDYDEPEVSDDQVEDAMKRLQRQEALVEESNQPVEMGNQVTVDIHSEFVDEPTPEVDDDEGDDDDSEGTEPKLAPPAQGTPFIHEHDASIILDAEEAPVLPGFSEALVGAGTDDELEFELTVPTDDESYADIAGRKVHFDVHIKKVESITLPALNDDFAARVTQDEEEPLTLLQLRMRMRETLEEQLKQRSQEAYASQVLSDMVIEADVAYPEAMVEDQIETLIKDLDQNLRQQGANLDIYMKVTETTMEDLQEQYRERAEELIERSLVIRQIVTEEKITVPDAKIQERINNMLASMGEQAEALRSMFDTPNMRSAIADDILQTLVMERIAEIGRGEAPDLETLLAEAQKAETDPDVISEAEFTPVDSAETSSEEVTETEEPADADANATPETENPEEPATSADKKTEE